MKMVKSLLLGTAAGLVAVAGAQAADMPVKAAPVQYVKICSLYGDGFYYIPGTDTCLKLGGYLRVQAEYNAGGGGISDRLRRNRGAAGPVHPRPYQRHQLPRPRGDLVGRAPADRIRHAAHLHPLRRGERPRRPYSGGGTTPTAFWDRAFIQFAGFTVGRSQSFFDLFTYGGAYSYHNVRVSGDTGASGQNLWAYTAQFGNGFSGTLSLEDPVNHRSNSGVIDVTSPGFFGFNGVVVADNAFHNYNKRRADTFGFRVPDIVANLRVDQAWGFAGISAALHNSSGAYYNTPNNVNNGHPEDKYGWALAGGAKFNLQGGDMIGFNVCYSEGAPAVAPTRTPGSSTTTATA